MFVCVYIYIYIYIYNDYMNDLDVAADIQTACLF